ncbi:MAG: CPBP family intramembrane glutamic endopeptidase [Candidatus Helarchaeales archaeon]
MIFSPVNFIYFAIVVPVALAVALLLRKHEAGENHVLSVVVLGILLFFVRIMLVPFQFTIGIMPYILPDVVFYGTLTFFGVMFSILYVLKVDDSTFEEIGFENKDVAKNVGIGLLGFLPLIAMFPLVMLLSGIVINPVITWEKVVIGILFGLILGGFYEETMFRGVIQNHLSEIAGEKKAVIYTALIFTATHVGYLPFTGFGIMYGFLFVMALLLSYFRYKFNQISCAVLHGGIVFVLILFA